MIINQENDGILNFLPLWPLLAEIRPKFGPNNSFPKSGYVTLFHSTDPNFIQNSCESYD